MAEERKIIDEANYQQPQTPRPFGPAVVGKGGDPLFMNIRATKAQLQELLDETTTVQDWAQRESCNNVALACLNNEKLKDNKGLNITTSILAGVTTGTSAASATTSIVARSKLDSNIEKATNCEEVLKKEYVGTKSVLTSESYWKD